MAPAGTDQRVHVVWHHTPRAQVVARSVEVPECITHNFARAGITKQALPVPCIEPVFDTVREQTIVFLRRLFRPRLSMSLQPGFAFSSELLDSLLRKGIRQAEGHKVQDALLSPVR